MRTTSYSFGLDVLGADVASRDTGRAILIKVLNPAQLARSQGTVASVAQALAPETIEKKVLDTISKELKSGLADKNVETDISVVQPAGFAPADGSHVWVDVAVGLGTVGMAAIVWRLLSGRK